MEKNKLKNQPCYDKDGNFLGWFSRSVATTVCIFRKNGNDLQVLLQKRGKGCPDNVGKWCHVCGYLEFDRTLEENAVKEAFEEVGIKLNKDKLSLLKISSNPSENHQNVSVHFYYFVSEGEDFDLSIAEGGEKDEVECAEWFTVGKFKYYNYELEIATDEEPSNIYEYVSWLDIYEYKLHEKDFAFNHDDLILKAMEQNFYIDRIYENEKEYKEYWS